MPLAQTLSTFTALGVYGVDMTVIFLAGALSHGIGVPQALFTYLDETNLSSRLSALCSLGQVEFRE